LRSRLGDLLDLVFALIDAFESSEIAYAFGGAIAYSTWAEPRATRDVDLNVWLPAEELAAGFDVLERIGATLDRDTAAKEASSRGMFVARYRDIRIDVFVPSVPFYEIAREHRRRVSFDGRPTWVLSPETLAVFKLLFHRPKDLADVQRMLELQGSRFDREFVTSSLESMLDAGDDKILEWERLQARVPTDRT
jgi:hypothetical protein